MDHDDAQLCTARFSETDGVFDRRVSAGRVVGTDSDHLEHRTLLADAGITAGSVSTPKAKVENLFPFHLTSLPTHRGLTREL
jgi:hypothetical protein